MWGEFTNPKPPLSVLESINFLPDTVMLFYFPLFSILLLGFHSPVLSAGAWLQCFARRGLCLCQPTITFPAEMANSFFSLLVFLRHLFLSEFILWKLIQHALKATFSAITEVQFSQRLWQRNFSILVCSWKSYAIKVCPICKPPLLLKAVCVCWLYNMPFTKHNFLLCCLNANKCIFERSDKSDCCDYCSSRTI